MYEPQFKSVCRVAGITKDSPLGRFTFIFSRKHFGIVRLKIDLLVEVVEFCDVEKFTDDDVPLDVEDDVLLFVDCV